MGAKKYFQNFFICYFSNGIQYFTHIKFVETTNISEGNFTFLALTYSDYFRLAKKVCFCNTVWLSEGYQSLIYLTYSLEPDSVNLCPNQFVPVTLGTFEEVITYFKSMKTSFKAYSKSSLELIKKNNKEELVHLFHSFESIKASNISQLKGKFSKKLGRILSDPNSNLYKSPCDIYLELVKIICQKQYIHLFHLIMLYYVPIMGMSMTE